MVFICEITANIFLSSHFMWAFLLPKMMTCTTCQPANCNCGNGEVAPVNTVAAQTCATSWTMADVHALEQAIKTGVSKVKYRDHEVTYRGIDEMAKTLRAMKAAVCPPCMGNGGVTQAVYRKSSRCVGTAFRGIDY